MDNLKKSIGLVRVSTVIQSDGSGLQFQTEKILQYGLLRDIEIDKVITDVCSGSVENRDGIKEVKTLVEEGVVDKVIIWNTSRFFRSMLLFSQFYDYLKKHNVELISVSEGLSSFSKSGSMVFGIMSSISEYEREIINERMMSGKVTKVMNGERKIGGRLCFGYSMNKGEVTLNENSEIVKFIFTKMNELMKKNITKTKRTQKLLKSLKRKGFKHYGKDFNNQNVKNILKNPFYFGELKYGDIQTPHIHPTLISKRLYNNVQYV